MQFPTTRWDELARASLHGDAEARTVLDEFCRRYWSPVNRFIRWKGYDEEDAADLTQDFFLNFLESRSWRRADRLRGSFRAFLLGALSHRLQKAHDRRLRLKRGGGTTPESLDELGDMDGQSPSSFLVAPADAAHFDRAWGVRLLEAALEAVRADYEGRGKGLLYAALKGFLTARAAPPGYEEVGRELGYHPGAVKTEIHRLRGAFRAALRVEIGRTVTTPHEIEEEFKHLRAVLAQGGNRALS